MDLHSHPSGSHWEFRVAPSLNAYLWELYIFLYLPRNSLGNVTSCKLPEILTGRYSDTTFPMISSGNTIAKPFPMGFSGNYNGQ